MHEILEKNATGWLDDYSPQPPFTWDYAPVGVLYIVKPLFC
jgi:hypothetical protein